MTIAIAAIMVGLSAAAWAQEGPTGEEQQSSLFHETTGGTYSYDEITTDLEPPPPATALQPGDSVPCATGSIHINCNLAYFGFIASDVNATGAQMSGTVVFANDDATMTHQAGVWVPARNGILLLDDRSELVAPGISNHGIGTYTQHGSYAFDLSADGTSVVGLADGTFSAGGVAAAQFGTYDFHTGIDWILPVLWTGAEGDYGTGLVLGLPAYTTGDGRYGGALAINDTATYIAGFSGTTNAGENEEHSQPQATIWRYDLIAYIPARISPIDLFPEIGNDRAHVANDVNAHGHVVGWSGIIDTGGPFPLVEGEEVLDVVTFSATTFTSRLPGWRPRPFVWTEDFDEARGLSLPSEPGSWLGEARAISNGGDVAAGFIFDNAASPFAPQGAAWINRGGATAWTADDLLVLNTPTPAPTDAVGAVNTIGSLANAVDDSGRLIVGAVVYDHTGGSITDSQAVFWELDQDFNLVRGELLQDALTGAGVPMDGAELVRLSEATGVRTELNEAGEVEAIYLSGVGEGSFGAWIARLLAPGSPTPPGPPTIPPTPPPPPGLTTPASIIASLGAPVVGVRDVAAAMGFTAENQRCIRPEGTPAGEEPWCAFSFGTGDVYTDSGQTGFGFSKQFGVAYFLDEVTQIGGSAGVRVIGGEVPGGSSYAAGVVQLGVYGAYEPELGFRAVASVTAGRIIDATFTRLYVNGAGTATSTGTSGGYGFGAFAELGYGLALDEATTLVPFLQASVSQAGLDGYTDAGGPFPATISDLTTTVASATIGVRAEHELTDETKLFGSLSLTAAAYSSSGIGATVAGMPFGLGAPGGPTSYATVSGGVVTQLDESTNAFASAAVSFDLGGFVGLGGKVGFSRSF